jgi:hypothetical protein
MKIYSAAGGRFNPTQFPKYGFTRYPEGDFSDDGNRFREYLFDGELPISYLRADGSVYISFHPDELDLNYEEYKNAPSYRESEKYNGVPEDQVDMQDLQNIATKYLKELHEIKDGLGETPDEDLQAYFDDNHRYNVKVYDMAKEIVRTNFDNLVALSKRPYALKNVFDYLRSLKSDANHMPDISNLNGAVARRYASPEYRAELDKKIENIDDNFYLKEIREYLEGNEG